MELNSFEINYMKAMQFTRICHFLQIRKNTVHAPGNSTPSKAYVHFRYSFYEK